METTIDFIKEISTKIYGKEIFFYDKEKNKWYSREHCDYINTNTVLDLIRYNSYKQVKNVEKSQDL